MQLVTLKFIRDTKGSCSCCAKDCQPTIHADDNGTRSLATFCFKCFQFLNSVRLVQSTKAL